MERFITLERRWPHDSRLHVYLLPDLDLDADLAVLVDRCRSVLTEFPFVASVQDQWLHITVQPIKARPASAIGPAERDLLVERLATALADVPPAQLTVGSVLAESYGVIADVDGDLPGGPFHAICQQVREAIGDVLGSDAQPSDPVIPHLTLGYGTGPGDSGEIQAALWRNVRPSHATMTVQQIDLLDVVQDAERSEYRWTPVARIPLGTAGAGSKSQAQRSCPRRGGGDSRGRENSPKPTLGGRNGGTGPAGERGIRV